MKSFKESTDEIMVDGKWKHFASDEAVPFIVIRGMCIGFTHKHKGYGYNTHFELKTITKKIIDNMKPKNFGELVKCLEDEGLVVMASSGNYKVDDIKNELMSKLSVYGRLWRMGGGFISFWNPPDRVRENETLVLQYIEKMGYNPNDVKWEISIRKGGTPDRDKGEYISWATPGLMYKLVDRETYFNTNLSSEERRKIADARMKHLVAGAKRTLDIDVPGKQLNPNMPNVQLKNMTTFGDSVKQFDKIVENILMRY